MFVVRPGVLLDLLGEQDPGFAAALRGIAADPATLDEVWPTLPRIAVDHAVAEPAAAAGRVAVVPGDLRLGRRRRLRLARRPCCDGDDAVTVLGDAGLVRTVDVDRSRRARPAAGPWPSSASTTSWSSTPATRCWSPRCERAQDVKSIVAALKEDGHDDLI